MTTLSSAAPVAAFPVLVGRTDFPMKPSARALPTPPSRVANADAPSFVLLDGPPYANGALHLGHVLNKHMKDALVRGAQASGHAVRWQPGWDCHGLPVELNVERQGVSRTPVGSFLTAARAYAQSQVDLQRTTFMEQGLSADWDRPYRTMDPRQEAATLNLFADMVERDHVVLRHKPTWWCPACGSTLATAEHEERERTVLSCFVAFDLLDRPNEVMLAWTTTAWTVPYHEGLVVNPNALYVAVRRTSVVPSLAAADERLAWVAEEALHNVLQAFPDAQRAFDVAPQPGHALAGWSYRAPFDAQDVRRVLVADASVQPGGGTGVLHAVPAFGHEDALLGDRFGWPMTHALLADGTFGPEAWPPHRGQPLVDAQRLALDALRHGSSASRWFQERPWTQEHPHCWRHKTPLVVRPSRQVYLNLDGKVRARAARMLEQVVFVPESGRARLHDAVSKRPDWCLSRQRTWGVPVALFVHRTHGTLHPHAVAVMRQVALRVADQGVEAWWSSTDAEWFETADPVTMQAHPLSDYERVPDVLDVWFDSGCAARSTASAGHVPDVVLEGHDQHRGWFQSSLWVAAALGDTLPYRTVVTHGFVVQTDGRKLSKSEGGDAAVPTVDAAPGKNSKGKKPPVKAPQSPVWSDLPSDVVRVWALQSACHLDKVWGTNDVRLAQDTYAKLRNSLRFGLANLPVERLTQTPSNEALAYSPERWWPMDRWAVVQAGALRDTALAAFTAGRFEHGVQALHRLANEVLSKGLYATQKDRLYCAAAGSEEREFALQALHAAWDALAQGLWVLTPNLMAELEQHLGAPLVALPAQACSFDVTVDEQAWWDRTLAVRQALQEVWAPWSNAHGGALQHAQATVVLENGEAWPWSREVLLDALGVSGVNVETVTLPGAFEPSVLPVMRPNSEGDALSVTMGAPSGVEANGWRAQVSVQPMAGEVCPRCRWVSARPLFVGLCERCHDRQEGAVKEASSSVE